MQKGEYQIQVAEDGLSVSFVRAIPSSSFVKKILKKPWARITVRAALASSLGTMQRQNVRPLNGLFWGKRQVVRLRWKCTGTPTAVNKHNYPTEYKVRDKRGVWHVQCDCIVLVTARKAEERTQAELEVESSYMDLFGVDSSQSQSQRSDPPSPPPRRRKKREERHTHAVNSSSEEEYDTRKATATAMAEASEVAVAEGEGGTRRGNRVSMHNFIV